jgi:hypothetical protein
MPRREFGHTVDKSGRPKVIETTLPKHLRGRSEYAVDTYTENQIARAAGAVVKSLFGGKR